MDLEGAAMKAIESSGDVGRTSHSLRKELGATIDQMGVAIDNLDKKGLIKARQEGIIWYWVAVPVDKGEPVKAAKKGAVAVKRRGRPSRAKSTPAEEPTAISPGLTPGSERQVSEEETSGPLPDATPPKSDTVPYPGPENYGEPMYVEGERAPDPFSEPGAFEISREGIEERDHDAKSVSFPVIEITTVQCSTEGSSPLALFAQRHRTRVDREIARLRKAERRLRRHAASAGAMAERVKAARRIKERELRRFEKELAEAT
jgi:hypothetical protein